MISCTSKGADVAMSRIVSRIALRTAFLLFPCVIAVCSGAGRPGSRDRGHHPVPQSDLSRDCNEPETLPNFGLPIDRKSTRLNSSHGYISYAVFCLKKKKKNKNVDSCMKIMKN